MTLNKTVRFSLVKQVVEQLVQRIESGSWPVGGRIPPEPELVRQLGVSRNTVREAVQALIHNGLLEARQGDGTYVRSASEFEAAMQRRLQRSSVAEILEVRCALEREIARLAAIRRTAEDLASIRAHLAEAIANRSNPCAYLAADLAFHRAIAAATHNRVMIDLSHYMTDFLCVSIRTTMDLAGLLETHVNTHSRLVEAIANQDPESAEEAARDLIRATQAAILDLNQERRI